MSIEWTAGRILSELCEPDLRREILAGFWKLADEQNRRVAAMQLSKLLHFREATILKAPAEKKADWLGSRIHARDLEQYGEMALMLYLTHSRREMLAAFLDLWEIPNDQGTIESDDYRVPTEEQVAAGVESLRERFPLSEIRLYLASAGLLMGDEWRAATWPVVRQLSPT